MRLPRVKYMMVLKQIYDPTTPFQLTQYMTLLDYTLKVVFKSRMADSVILIPQTTKLLY